jgi:WD40 repeat protein
LLKYKKQQSVIQKEEADFSLSLFLFWSEKEKCVKYLSIQPKIFRYLEKITPMKNTLIFAIFVFILTNIAGSQDVLKTLKGPTQWPVCAIIEADGSTLYVGSYDKQIWVFDIATGLVKDTMRFHESAVTSLDISKQGILASAGWDQQIVLWKETKKSPLLVLKGHQDKINAVKFSPDGKMLASVGDDGMLIVRDVTTGGIIKEIQAHKDPATSLCFKSDGKVIATTSWDKTVKLWNVATGECLNTFKGHTNAVNYCTYSNTERYLVSCSDDNSMIVWEVATGTIFKKFDFYRQPVVQALFVNNDNQLISVDQQGELKIYNVNSHQLMTVQQAHRGKIYGMAWNPANGTLVTFGEDLNIHIWDMGEYAHYECMKKKIPTIEYLRRAKGEFETTVQYEARLQDYEKRKLLLVDECKKDAMIEKLALERMKLENEAKAYSRIELNFTSVGTYDADVGEYPIVVNNQSYILSMQPEEARTFKDSWQKIKIRAVRKDIGEGMYLYFNMEMTHPVTGRIFKFGEQISLQDDPAYKIFSESRK